MSNTVAIGESSLIEDTDLNLLIAQENPYHWPELSGHVLEGTDMLLLNKMVNKF